MEVRLNLKTKVDKIKDIVEDYLCGETSEQQFYAEVKYIMADYALAAIMDSQTHKEVLLICFEKESRLTGPPKG